ncbi:MAG: hypothetical protein WA061_01945 [Microgenomates group bacterium]
MKGKNYSVSFRPMDKFIHFHFGKDENWLGLKGVWFFIFQIGIFHRVLEVIWLIHE